MELTLGLGDLMPEHKQRHRRGGRAQFIFRDGYNAIYPPKEQP